MHLYNRHYTRREIEARAGRLEQIGGVRRFRWTEGPEAGVSGILVRTGAGLAYTVVPDRGLDISLAEFAGAPLSWQSANGEVHPAAYDDQEANWLRTAVGGLLMTCGLSYAGAPGEDQGQSFGLHGRAHHLPARQVVAEGRWRGDEYDIRIAGVVDETIMFGEHLRLTREITGRLGENRIVLHDVVENIGFEPAPHMLLYHFNYGFPLLDEETRFTFPPGSVRPRDAGTPMAGYDHWAPPEPGHAERVYYHEGVTGETAAATIHNPRFPLPGGPAPLTVALRWSPSQLPRLVQWRMPGAGLHVLGIEPANCVVEGRAKEREHGTLVTLQPGESRTYDLTLEVTVG